MTCHSRTRRTRPCAGLTLLILLAGITAMAPLGCSDPDRQDNGDQSQQSEQNDQDTVGIPPAFSSVTIPAGGRQIALLYGTREGELATPVILLAKPQPVEGTLKRAEPGTDGYTWLVTNEGLQCLARQGQVYYLPRENTIERIDISLPSDFQVNDESMATLVRDALEARKKTLMDMPMEMEMELPE